MAEANTPVQTTAPGETEAAWHQIVRQLSATDHRTRDGSAAEDDEASLREMRITLGLAFASEVLRLAGLVQDLRKASASRPDAP
ncbi:hypothetical protein GMJLKIPL_1796 [Methylobacterium isbiliense]|jgi:hypothetical protein|uniref:Uncharacterized protein n=1 Tax=Methylobacterium isbiliense TaxID=315478 RepID=A0ABQ4SA88_9HYPH|nr:hypothetical protein GMJLKIPL_1796 [Methylobacterium isbiliense]